MSKNQKRISRKENSENRVFLVVIDESQEQHQAVRFACKRAHSTGGRVALFNAKVDVLGTPPGIFATQ